MTRLHRHSDLLSCTLRMFVCVCVCLRNLFHLSYRLHANLSKGFGVMGPKEFFPLLDFAYMPKNALSARYLSQAMNAGESLSLYMSTKTHYLVIHCYFSEPQGYWFDPLKALVLQPAGAVAEALPTAEGTGVRSETGVNAAYILPFLSVQSHGQLSGHHEKRGMKCVVKHGKSLYRSWQSDTLGSNCWEFPNTYNTATPILTKQSKVKDLPTTLLYGLTKGLKLYKDSTFA